MPPNKNLYFISKKIEYEMTKLPFIRLDDYEDLLVRASTVNEYYRFLLLLPESVHYSDYPDFKTWQDWTEAYPGWKYGQLDHKNPAWSDEFEGFELPMNKFY
jgi:hypothetical protein